MNPYPEVDKHIVEEGDMRKGVSLVLLLLLAVSLADCGGRGIIARGGRFVLTVDDLRFEIRQLGPQSRYDETFEARKGVVERLAARSLLAEEAVRRGWGGRDLESARKQAEEAAVAQAYHLWKIEKRVLLPRVKTKPWLEKLDRGIHLKEIVFAVYAVAEEVLETVRQRQDFDTLAGSLADREDVKVNDLGWVLWKDLGWDVANVVFRLDKGNVSDIVTGPDGYHIFYVADDKPLELGIELLSIRSKRFVAEMEEQELVERVTDELAALYDVRFLDDGLSAGLKSFAMSFRGKRPPDSLLNFQLAAYDAGKVLVADLYNLYYSLPERYRPYIGDRHALERLAMQVMQPTLEALAGYAMGLDRLREVGWAVKQAQEDYLVGMMEEDFRSQVHVSDQDIVNFYSERESDFHTTPRYRVRRILLSSREEADEALRQIGSGRDFAQVAAEMSQDARSASGGGDLGFINFGMVTYYDSVVAGLNPGEVSEPFSTTAGTEILKLEEVDTPRQLSLEEATETIRRYISEARANALLAEWVAAKKQEVGFEMDEDLLRRVALPQPKYKDQPADPGRPGAGFGSL